MSLFATNVIIDDSRRVSYYSVRVIDCLEKSKSMAQMHYRR